MNSFVRRFESIRPNFSIFLRKTLEFLSFQVNHGPIDTLTPRYTVCQLAQSTTRERTGQKPQKLLTHLVPWFFLPLYPLSNLPIRSLLLPECFQSCHPCYFYSISLSAAPTFHNPRRTPFLPSILPVLPPPFSDHVPALYPQGHQAPSSPLPPLSPVKSGTAC